MIEKIYDHSCTRCPLHKTVEPPGIICVGGSGDYSSKGMILGEAPGREESLTGIPFVGRAGQMLETALEASGTDRTHLFVTNTVKCRPPENRKPELSEEESCRLFLRREIEIVQPHAILALGNHALRATTGLWGITKFIGIWHSVPRLNQKNLLVLPNYHPAYVLRQPSLTSRFQEVVQDFVDRINQQN